MTTRRYPYSYEDVFSAALHGVKDCNFNTTHIDKSKGIIKASSGISIRSWGETIHISIKNVKNEVEVSINSEAEAQIIDWGKSTENISRLFKHLENYLGD